MPSDALPRPAGTPLALAGAGRPPRCATQPPSRWFEDVARFDRLGAGHAVERHVHGLAEDILRLRRDPTIHAAGSFPDVATLQWAVDRAAERSALDVIRWAAGPDGDEPFIREVPLGMPVGHTITREDLERGRPEQPCTGVRIVVFPEPALPSGLALRTAYPVRVPTPAAKPFRARSLRTYELAGGRTLGDRVRPGRAELVLELRRDPQRKTASRFLSADAAQRVVEEAVAYWSAEIATWLSGSDPTFQRTYCAAQPVGETLQQSDLVKGVTRPTATPVIVLELRRSPVFDEGFTVAEARPVRGF